MTRHLVSVVSRSASGLIVILALASPLYGQNTSEETRKEETRQETSARSSAESGEQSASDEERTDRKERAERSASTVRRIDTTRRVDDGKTTNVSPLVQAAQSTGAKSSKRSFTDADLKTTKGSLIVVEGSNVKEPKVVPIEQRSPEAVKAAREAGIRKETPPSYGKEIAIKRLQEEIVTLREDLSRLQNEYLVTEEDDYRESVEERFVSKQKALEEAQKKLKELQGSGGN